MNKVVIFLLYGVLSLVCDKAKGQSVFAGTGSSLDSNDGSYATSAGLYSPRHVAADGLGNIYITTGYSGTDSGGNVKVRKIDSSGIISTYAGGNSDSSSYYNSGVAATNVRIHEIHGLAVDSSNNLYISARVYTSMNYPQCAIRKVDYYSQQISTYAGQVSFVYSYTCSYSSGDGGSATSAYLYYNRGIAFDSSNNLYVAEGYRLRKVTSGGIISTYAGNGNSASSIMSGMSYTPTSVSIDPYSVTVDSSDNVYFTDGDYYIRKIASGGNSLTNFVGNGGSYATLPNDGTSTGFSTGLYSSTGYGTSGFLTNDGTDLYVVDNYYGIVKVSSTGYASQLLSLSYSYEYHLTAKSGALYYSDTNSNKVYMYDLTTSSASASASASSGFSLSSYFASNKQKVVALAVSAATVLAHFGVAAYLVSSKKGAAASEGSDGSDGSEEAM